MPRAGNLLKTYNAKRDFRKTREPKGKTAKKHARAIFVVQKHAATRLHWDFRLELDGVLKSWAVTNEPVADPSVKRLAVRVEDHPLSYAGFEGDIPKGQYGGGHVDIWDRGTWTPIDDPKQGLRKGKLSFTLSGKRMKGRWTLVRMRPKEKEKRENWLLIKANDNETEEAAESRTAILAAKTKKSNIDYRPALALRVDEPPAGDEWLHEIKYDGYRALLHIEKGRAKIITRGGQDWTDRFPDIAEAAEKLKLNTDLDGEIVVFKDNGMTDFGLLQQTLSGDRNEKIVFMAFDLLSLTGKDCKKRPLIERKKMLRKILPERKNGPIRYSDHVIGGGKKFFQAAKRLKVEGIVSKKADSVYHGDRRGDWLKVKISQTEEFVIGGLLRRTDDKMRVGAVLLGYFEGGDFFYAGKSGTGFAKPVSDALLKAAKAYETEKSPFTAGPKPKDKKAQWLKPKLVAVIEYTERTKDNLVRHAVYKGLREDKPAKQVHLETVRALKTTMRKDVSYTGVTITHPDRVVFPESGETKADVAAYYDAVADRILPYIKGRPLSVIRCPDGLKARCFFQRHLEGSAAENLTQLPITEPDTGKPYFSADTKKALLSLIQHGVIELHPWQSKSPVFDKPDRMIFDLDPDPRIDWPSVKAAAEVVKKKLDKLKLKSFLKTTGGKGLHVVVPIKPVYEWDDVKSFTKKFVQDLEREYPDAFTSNPSKAQRIGKIYLDYLRNDEASTAVAPYSLRARPGAPVSMPLKWSQLKALKSPQAFTLASGLKSGKSIDPWAALAGIKQNLPKSIV